MISHFIVGSGLLLALTSGLLLANHAHWSYFKGTGYMHAKMLLVVIFFILLAVDIRIQKNMQRKKPANEILAKSMKTRLYVNVAMLSNWLFIAVLIVLRPF